jgi:hypothetical protein
VIDRWIVSNEPDWLINSIMQTVACLPHLTELGVDTWYGCNARIPFSFFSNLSKLSVSCSQGEQTSSFISQVSTVIANSPRLKSLTYGVYSPNGVPLPTLSNLFAKIPTENPLHLEHLSIDFMDVTVNQTTLPHLMHLTSFWFRVRDENYSVARGVWTSFLVHNVKLSDVEIDGIINEETMLYLSSFSGLKRLAVGAIQVPPDATRGNLKNTLFTVVLPKHVNSLRTLEIHRTWVTFPYYTFCVTFSLTRSH